LLDAGARVDDGESLYHATELHDTSCLELLFAAGVPDGSRDYCIRRCLDSANANALRVYLKYGASPHHLDYALFRNRSMQIIEMLVEHGADLNKPTDDFWLLERIRELTPVQIAERAGAAEAVSYLLAKGAVDNRTPRDLLIGACARADEEATRRILREYSGVVETLTERDHGNIAALARQGRLTSVRLMLDTGFDIDSRADDLEATALHYAASNGDVAMAELLLSRGARFDLKHKYGGTPLATAIYCAANFRNEHGEYAAVVQLLIDAGEKVTNDRLEFAVANDLDEIATVLKAHGASL
jgi:ankyrin repeat protein